MSRHLRLLSAAAKTVDSRSARSVQRKVGASEIGVCRRRAGYSHHAVKPSDPDNVSGLKAVHGTWIHKGALDTMRREWGSLIETTVEDDVLRGHVDAIELPNEWRVMAGLPEIEDAPDVVEVDDLKTKDDARAIDYVRIRGPKRSELYQVMLYADLLRRGKVGPLTGRWKNSEKALLQALDTASADGLPVERIRLRYVPRTGQEDVEYVHEQDFDQDIADEAWAWVEQVATSESPEDLPRDQDGPDLSVVCDNCPFVTACWGESVEGQKRQSLLVVTDADKAQALQEYDEGRALEREGKAKKDLARAKLDGLDRAVYTDGRSVAFKLGWSGGRLVDAVQEPDVEKMLALFETAEIPVPMKEVPAHRTARTIAVVPWEAPDPACGKPAGDPPYWWPAEPDGKAKVWRQDRPRGGWTGYDDDPAQHDLPEDQWRTPYALLANGVELTAGQFVKLHPEYVDPRLPCVLKPKHSVPCVDVEPIVVLDLDDDLETAADAPEGLTG